MSQATVAFSTRAISAGVQESRDRIVDRFDPIVGCRVDLGAAGLGLELQLTQLRLARGHWQARQRRFEARA
jgi:hypothetical protein